MLLHPSLRASLRTRSGADRDVTARVRAELMLEAALRTRDIHISTCRGAVRLSGCVASYEEKDVAGAVAGRVEGVRSVRNHLEVRVPRPRTPSY